MTSVHQIVCLDSGVSIEVELLRPPARGYGSATEPEGSKLAVCLHPWSWLGGRMNDPVLESLIPALEAHNYHVVRFNSRGVGQSSGWPSLSGLSESKDLQAVVQWGLQQVPNTRIVTIIGYSHGALIASLHGTLPSPVTVSHLLLSYPLGPRGFLTLFHGNTYASKLKELIQNPTSNVLILFGDQDEFTGSSNYRKWQTELEGFAQGEDRGKLKIVMVPEATHFWLGRLRETLLQEVESWLP